MSTENKLYDHIAQEKAAQELWLEHDIYKFTPTEPGKVFSIDTPPPTVSGALHLGHVFSYTHPDLIARYKRMKGFSVFYPMGFDDNGLATERFVEKKNSTKAHLMPRSEFVAMCRRDSHEAEKQFEELWKKLGLSIDWTKLYSTISPEVQRVAQYSFIELFKKDLVYRKQEPALYCTTCRTSVAQAELDSVEVTTTFNNIVFTAEDGQRLTIATTRPELLPACVAVFFHPEDLRYKHLAGTYAITPVFEQRVRIIADENVDPAKGTGLVMCCTFGDQTDIMWYKTHKLPFLHIIGFDGKWTAASGPLAGLPVHEARKKVIELLKETGTLESQKSIVHAVNTHERCRQEIEYLILNQWFIKILENKDTFVALADQINWYPSFMKARYKDWVSNLHWDWGISRQRYSGIPFPAWHCQDCGHIIVADEKQLPIDPRETSFTIEKCPECSGTTIEPDTDVMDTWNTSSLSPQINAKWPDVSPDKLTLPMSMRPQAHDIIRTWAFYTIVKAHLHNNCLPWRDIVISGHVLAGKGEKLSKSKENNKLSPEELLKTFPADVIRYWAANGKLGADTALSENQFKIGQRLITKLWNAFRFIEQHIKDYDRQTLAPKDTINQWLWDSFSNVYKNYQQQFDTYEYQAALEYVEKFFWQDFCDNYLELVKDRLFNQDKYAPDVIAEIKATLYHIGYGLLQLFAPFLPHITESLYQEFYKNDVKTTSIHQTLFDNRKYDALYPQSVATTASLLSIVTIVRKLKSESQLSLKTPLQTLTIYCNDALTLGHLEKLADIIGGISKAEKVTFAITDQNTQTKLEKQDDIINAHIAL